LDIRAEKNELEPKDVKLETKKEKQK